MKKLLAVLSIFIISCNSVPNKQIHDILCTSYDGKIWATIQEKDSQNEALRALHKTANDGDVFLGKMSSLTADTDNIGFKGRIEIKDISYQTIAKLMQAGESYVRAKETADSDMIAAEREKDNNPDALRAKANMEILKRKTDSMMHKMREDSIKFTKETKETK